MKAAHQAQKRAKNVHTTLVLAQLSRVNEAHPTLITYDGKYDISRYYPDDDCCNKCCVRKRFVDRIRENPRKSHQNVGKVV